jgi:hypothetical protein
VRERGKIFEPFGDPIRYSKCFTISEEVAFSRNIEGQRNKTTDKVSLVHPIK